MAAQPARENRSSPKHDPEARLRSFSTRRFRHEILPAHGFMGIRRSQLLSFAPARPKSFIGLLNRVLAGAQSKPELPEKSSRRAAFTNLPTSRNRVVAAYPGSGHRLEIEIAKFRLRNPPGNFSQSRRLLPAARTPSYPDALVVLRSDIQSASFESRRSDVELLLPFRPGCRLLRRLLPPRRHGRLVSIPVHHCHNLHSRLTNGTSLHHFARNLYADLTKGQSVVLGNDFVQLSLLRTELAAQNYAKDALVVELPMLGSAQYHVFMARQFGHRWPVIPPTNAVDLVGPIKLLKLVSAFAEHEPVVYLDPNFGPLFDRPSDSVTGFIHHFATKPESGEPINEMVWQQRWTNHLQALAAYFKAYSRHSPEWLRFLQAEPNATASFLAATYSKSLNNWGVQSQRLGHWAEADESFQRSLDLNPQNLSAHINLEFNQRWQRGEKTRLNPAAVQKQYADLFSRRNDWREVLSDFGPVDEPTFLFRTGRAFLANGNTRLAASAFHRSAELASDWSPPKLWLAQSFLEQGNFAEALDITER